MCGYVGWVDPQPQSKDILETMTTRIAHRGPDDFGYFYQENVALGHCRLAIIDAGASIQPMRSANGQYVLAYNGELYNFKELRTELTQLGHTFTTNGDTEVLLEALIEWGEAALPRLQGMFSFAFYNFQDQSLLLARDHIGVKPLYISWDGSKLLFASEIKALLAHPHVSHELDPHALGLYLECQYIPAPHTIFRQIRKLPPAHSLKLQNQRIEQKKYWTPEYLPKFDYDEPTALERLESELRKSVSSMLMSDAPIGAFVSGGIDSSLIAALMQSESGKKTNIFHLGFENQMQSEHENAALVASYLGASHYPLMVQSSDILNAIDQFIETFDGRVGDQAAIPTMLLAKMTRSHVKVVLTGEGSDEVLAGYSNYSKKLKEASIASKLGSHFSPLPYLYPFLPTQLRKNRLIKAASRPLPQRYTTIPNLFDREQHKQLFSKEFHTSQGPALETLAETHYHSCNSTDYLDKMLHIDANLWLADDLLTKVDKATMAYSIEARVPYLDHRFVEFAARLPTHLKMNGVTGKYLLKKLACKGLIPPEIATQKKKGFVLPLREWMRKEFQPLLNDTFSENGLLSRNLFRPGVLETLRHEEATQKRLNATRLWSLIVLELWLRRYAPNYRCT